MATEAQSRRMHPAGWSRYFDACILVVWLTFWVAGEAAGLALFGAMLASAVSAALGRPLALVPRVAPTDGSVSIFLFFVLIWLGLWTIAGLAATTHLLRNVAGGVIVEVTASELRFVRRAGTFHRRRIVPRTAIRRVRRRGHDEAVVVDTHEGTVVVSDLGAPDARASLLQWLSERLSPPDAAQAR